MKSWLPIICVLTLLLTGCETEIPESDSNLQVPKRPCQQHSECEANEICYPEEGCVPPWGRRFVLEDLHFEGPSSSFEDRCAIVGLWTPQRSSGESIQFKKGDWKTIALEPWYNARPDSPARVFLNFFHDEDDTQCPSHEVEGPLCLDGACGPFRIEHYRSADPIRLSNATGDALVFRLVPTPEAPKE